MGKLLQTYGFILVDDQGRNQPLLDANKAQMDTAADLLFALAGKDPEAEVVVYYSGHGIYLHNKTRPKESANYFIPAG